MEINLSCRSYKQYVDEIIEFRNQNRNDYRDEIYFHWRYCERPNGSDAIVVLARTGKKELIGSLSIIPHHYVVNNVTKLFGVIGDISVKSEFRGKGIATKMINYLKEDEKIEIFECLMVLPNDAALIPLQRAGWVKITSLQKFVTIVDIGYILEQQSLPELSKKVLTRSINELIKLIYFENYINKEYTCGVTETLDDDFDKLWNAIDKNNLIIGCRNRAYLQWRYVNHPLTKYKIFSLYRKNLLCGFIVFHQANEKIVQIDDFLFLETKKDLRYLFLSFLKFIRDGNMAEVVYLRFSDRHSIKNKLKRYGFIKRKDHQDLIAYRNPNTANDLSKIGGGNWFITAGDKDV